MPRPKAKSTARTPAKAVKPPKRPTAARTTRPKAPARTPAKPTTAKRQKSEANEKLIRWVDLLAALLGHDRPAPLEELKEEVPGYQRIEKIAALRRAFERDKDELREFGIPIVTERDPNGEVRGYRLRREHFYLPYLALLQDGRVKRPTRVDRYGYKALTELTFEADELEAVAEAAVRVRRLGIPALVELVRSAMRKLAFDLPMDVAMLAQEPTATYEVASPVVEPGTRRQLRSPRAQQRIQLPDVFAELDAALRARKRVTITYTTMGTGVTTTRDVHPHGLFFLGHHWYLAATDAGSDGPVKNFRVSRIRDATVNTAKPGTPDYEIAPAFQLRDHARSREAWELGDTVAVEAVVRFTGESGPTVAARRLGEPVPGAPECRRFQVRRLDTFARWILSFAGEAEPVSPPELVAAYAQVTDATLALYAEA